MIYQLFIALLYRYKNQCILAISSIILIYVFISISEDRDKLPNETRAKNEELVKSQASSFRLQQNCISILFVLLSIYQLLAR